MKDLTSLIAVFIAILYSFSACTPKASPELLQKREKAVQKDTSVTIKVDSLSKCTKFTDIQKEDAAIEAYVLYRDFFKLKKYETAYTYWKKVYAMAPAADGKRYNVYTDGVYIMADRLEKASDSTTMYNIIDTILTLYDEAIECYPKYEGYLIGRKAFDIYYKFPNSYTKQQQYDFFKLSYETQEKKPVFIFNPMTSLLVNQFLAGNIDTVEARKMAVNIRKDILKGIESGEQKESWDIVKNYALNKLEKLEAVKDFYDCNYYRKQYLEPYLANDSSTCDDAVLTYSKLRWGGCDKENADLKQIEERLRSECKLVPGGASSLAREGFEAYQEGKYSESVDLFHEAIEQTEDTNRKAKYAMMIANIQFVYLKDFPASRKAALQAADFKENYGAPYLLIGKLYASSGPLCGPGRGWDSQIVTWAAIDKWQYAKKIDPSVADEAQKLINQYWQYMPTKEDISKRLYKVGQRFTVPCWIQERTTIRASRNY